MPRQSREDTQEEKHRRRNQRKKRKRFLRTAMEMENREIRIQKVKRCIFSREGIGANLLWQMESTSRTE